MRAIIEILFTNDCCNNCSYCVSNYKKDKVPYTNAINENGDYQLSEGILNLSQLKRWLLDQKEKCEDMQLVISGGEPTLLRHYVEFLEWCHAKEIKTPIMYTNGLNLKDLLNAEIEPKKLVKILLTHHFTIKGQEELDIQKTKDKVNLLKEIEVPFILKLLTGGDDLSDLAKLFNCRYVIEGIKRHYSSDPHIKANQLGSFNAFSEDSPYRWRWKGYGNLINRERTLHREATVLTVNPTGAIFNCHEFNNPISTIYDLEQSFQDMQPVICTYQDNPNNKFFSLGKYTRCEILHYVNLFDNE